MLVNTFLSNFDAFLGSVSVHGVAIVITSGEKKINWSSKKISKRATSIQSVRELVIWPTASCHWIAHLILTALRMSTETNKDGV